MIFKSEEKKIISVSFCGKLCGLFIDFEVLKNPKQKSHIVCATISCWHLAGSLLCCSRVNVINLAVIFLMANIEKIRKTDRRTRNCCNILVLTIHVEHGCKG